MFRGALTVALALAGLVGLACSSGGGDGGPIANPDDERFTQKASVAGIDIQVNWLGSDDELGDELAKYPVDRFVLFEVSLDTHSGDLGSIDIMQAARLLVGANFRLPQAWVATSDDSHHRSGVLVFPRDGVTGPAALSLDFGAESVEFGWDEAPG